jgi:hypothetical protein
VASLDRGARPSTCRCHGKDIASPLVIAGAFTTWSYMLTPKLKLPYVYDDKAAAFAKARAEGKGVMVDFAASWCIPCGELKLTFGDDDYDLITKNFGPSKSTSPKTNDTSAATATSPAPCPPLSTSRPMATPSGCIDHMMEPDEM